MVVGDWSLQPEDFSPNVLFGPAEDQMLRRMITAMELVPAEVYLTNCVKCSPGGDAVPDTHCLQRCASFLAREISAVDPQVICAMGEEAARMLTGSQEPLSRFRGRFARCRCDPSSRAVVMPTFHPRFLLQHPEMKKATWRDLLAVKQRLAGRGRQG
jgi:DNA polymerase